MLKDIVVNLAIGEEKDHARDYAISVAAAFGAHLTGIAFVYDPILPPTLLGGIPADFIAQQREQAEKAAAESIAAFEAAATAAGVACESRKQVESLSGAAEMFGRIARRFDLAIVGQAEPDKFGPGDMIAEAALFDSGRPVLIVPYIQRDPVSLERVMLCWDGSAVAARAIADAMPMLSRATMVEVVIGASERARADEIPGADIAHHLARHNLPVEMRRITLAGGDVGETLLSHAADVGATLIVMGGYGHSRLREFILGGATRGILKSMTVPVLMSH
jgi:nucleotide-binding universal stress UspA family protein